MNTLERFYTCRETKFNNQINDKPTVKVHTIFETTVHEDPCRRRKTPLQTTCKLLSYERPSNSTTRRNYSSIEDRSPLYKPRQFSSKKT